MLKLQTYKNLTYVYQRNYITLYNDSVVNFASETGQHKLWAGALYNYNHSYFIPDSAPRGLYTFRQTDTLGNSGPTYINISFVAMIN